MQLHIPLTSLVECQGLPVNPILCLSVFCMSVSVYLTVYHSSHLYTHCRRTILDLKEHSTSCKACNTTHRLPVSSLGYTNIHTSLTIRQRESVCGIKSLCATLTDLQFDNIYCTLDQILARNQEYASRWQVSKHQLAPKHIRQVVTAMMTIRLVDHQPASVLALIPNELMFLIFWFLPCK
jgi:hypothetical protein